LRSIGCPQWADSLRGGVRVATQAYFPGYSARVVADIEKRSGHAVIVA
jgi:hypothetical protein